MILDATETVLRTFGCERIVYWGFKKEKGKMVARFDTRKKKR
jgi:hypothetical protein